MIVLTNSAAQTVQPNQAVTFDTVVMHTGRGESHRPGSGSVELNFNGIYDCKFGGNAASAQLSLALNSAALNETIAINENTAIANLSCETVIRNHCASSSITVINTGTTEITLSAYPRLFIKRVA